jgi:type I restriction enzyme, S subunit
MHKALPWPEVRLGDICKVVRGGSPRPAGDPRFFGGEFIPWLTVAAITNVSPSQTVITEAVGFLTEEGSRRSRRFQPGMVVIANSGWKCGVAKVLGFECCGNDGIAALENLTAADPAFLTYWINSQTERLRSQAAAGNEQPNLNTDRIASLSIPLPAITEQQAIVAALSDADWVVAGLERVIAKKRMIKQGAMQDLLTARRRLPGFSGEWEVKRLGDHVRFLKTGTHSRAQLSEHGPVKNLHYGDIHGAASIFLSPATKPMPTLDSVSAGRLDRLAAGDLVFVDASEDLAGVGTSVEIADLVETEVVSGLHTIAARFDKSILVDGFKAFLQFVPAFRSHLCQLAAGTKVLATNRRHISSAEIALPRPDEQQAIATVLSDMDTEIQTLESRLAKARAVKEGMMQNLLTGRVRLV